MPAGATQPRWRRGAHGARKNAMRVSRDGSACKGGLGWRLTARRIGRDAPMRDARASRCTRVSEKPDEGFTGRLGLQRWPEEQGGSGHASLASGGAPIGGGCCRADWHFARPLQPPSRFSETLMNDSLRKKGCDNQCTQETRPEDKRGSASPQGEARRECAAKAERSECRGGTLLTRVRVILGLRGGGGWVEITKPKHAISPSPPPQSAPFGANVSLLGLCPQV